MEEIFISIALIVATVASYNLGKIFQKPETRKETFSGAFKNHKNAKRNLISIKLKQKFGNFRRILNE